MKGFRNRTPNELKAFREKKAETSRLRLEELSKRKAEIVMKKVFRADNILIDKYITYSNKRMNLNKKSFVRLMAEGKAKWGL